MTRQELLDRLTVERFGTYREVRVEARPNYESRHVQAGRVAALAAEVRADVEEE